MAQFILLRINRENSQIKLPDGGSIPALVVTFNPILSAKDKTRFYVEAEKADAALALGKLLFPNFTHRLAVQEFSAYDNPPANEPSRIFRATKARSN